MFTIASFISCIWVLVVLYKGEMTVPVNVAKRMTSMWKRSTGYELPYPTTARVTGRRARNLALLIMLLFPVYLVIDVLYFFVLPVESEALEVTRTVIYIEVGIFLVFTIIFYQLSQKYVDQERLERQQQQSQPTEME